MRHQNSAAYAILGVVVSCKRVCGSHSLYSVRINLVDGRVFSQCDVRNALYTSSTMFPPAYHSKSDVANLGVTDIGLEGENEGCERRLVNQLRKHDCGAPDVRMLVSSSISIQEHWFVDDCVCEQCLGHPGHSSMKWLGG